MFGRGFESRRFHFTKFVEPWNVAILAIFQGSLFLEFLFLFINALKLLFESLHPIDLGITLQWVIY